MCKLKLSTKQLSLLSLLTSLAGSAKDRVSEISPPSCLAGQGMGENLAGHGMGERRQDVQQRFALLTAAHLERQVGSTNVRPPLTSSQNHRLGTQAHWQCPRHGRSRQGNRLRLPRVGAHGIYDTNDPQPYISPVYWPCYPTADSESSRRVVGPVASVRGEEEEENLSAFKTLR
jgi:hypothetical protein